MSDKGRVTWRCEHCGEDTVMDDRTPVVTIPGFVVWVCPLCGGYQSLISDPLVAHLTALAEIFRTRRDAMFDVVDALPEWKAYEIARIRHEAACKEVRGDE